MSFGGSGKGGAVCDINVTPLVDVLLVLLIIFMIAAPNVTKGPEVKLPGSRLAGPLPIDEEKLTIVIRKERVGNADQAVVYFGPTRLDPARLADQIGKSEKIGRDQAVFVQAEESLPYGQVQRVMNLLRVAGAQRVGLVTDPME